MKLRPYLYTLLLFLLWSTAGAQSDSSMRLNETEWEKVRENTDYTETYRTPEQKKETPKNNTSSPSENSSDSLSDFKYVFYFLILALIVYLVYRVLKSVNANPDVELRTTTLESIQEIEEKIHELDLEDLLKQALSQKNYRVALRLRFLIIIKLLSQNGNIDWAKEKTNWEYYHEVKNKLIADQFKTLIRDFELVWYGEHPFTESHYLQAETLYVELQNQLNKHE